MKLKILRTTVLLIACFIGSLSANLQQCNGEDADFLADGCEEITSSPLVIRGGVDEATLEEKLSKVKVIREGVKVIGTKIVEFSLLKNVEEIHNSNGPAMLFSGNLNLKRIHLPSLRTLQGDNVEHDLVFNKDHFPVAAYENSDAMSDLLHIETIARQTSNREACFDKFMRIVAPEPGGLGWLFYTLIVANVIAAAVLAVLVYQVVKHKKAAKKKKSGSGEQPKEKEATKGKQPEKKTKEKKTGGKEKNSSLKSKEKKH